MVTFGSKVSAIMKTQPLSDAIELLGLKTVSAVCGVTYQAVRKWERAGRMPRTEFTGETAYADAIAQACAEKDTGTTVTREALLGASMPQHRQLDRVNG